MGRLLYLNVIWKGRHISFDFLGLWLGLVWFVGGCSCCFLFFTLNIRRKKTHSVNNTLNMKKIKLGIQKAKCLYIHRILPKMENLSPGHYNIARGKANRFFKVTKTHWVMKCWENLQCIKKQQILLFH